MSDEKPKHKPQKKHTLSEVLKSLQDLIRTELISAKTAPAPTGGAAPASRAPSPPASEPDSFNQALDALDEIITQKIIEPVERARSSPPEPLLPDEVIEIDWEEAFGSGTPNDKSDTTPAPEATAEANASVEETIELQAIPYENADTQATIESAGDAPVAQLDAAKLTAIELTAVSPEAEVTALDASQPTEQTKERPRAAAGTERKTSASPGKTQRELSRTGAHVADAPTVDATASATLESLEAEPMTTVDISANPPAPPTSSARENAADVPTVVVEYESKKPEATTIEWEPPELPATKPPAQERPPAKPKGDRSKPPDSPRVVTMTSKSSAVQAPKKPLELAPDSLATTAVKPEVKAETPKRISAPKVTPAAKPKPTEPRAPVQEEIPVLKEVAPIEAPRRAPLPPATQAREIAIRVIARLNIERRKNGEAPLDIKTIERLQQYLADALSKRQISKPHQ